MLEGISTTFDKSSSGRAELHYLPHWYILGQRTSNAPVCRFILRRGFPYNVQLADYLASGFLFRLGGGHING